MAQALYAPQVPAQNEPDYTGRFKPARPYEGDQSGKYRGQATQEAFSGAGKAIGQGAQALDETMKSYIKSEVHQGADPLQEAMTKQLEQTLQSVEGSKAETGKAVSPTDPVWEHQSKDMPEDLRQNVNNARMLQDAREYGKIPYTYYLGRLNELAKSLRSQWPGYRDEIDNEMHKITGHPIGNAYMLSLISDIQSGMQGKDKVKDKVLEHLTTAAFRDRDETAANLATLVQTGQINPNYAMWQYTQQQTIQSKAANLEAQVRVMESTNKLYDQTVYRAASSTFSGYVSSAMSAGFWTLEGKNISLNDYIVGVREGRIPIDNQQTQLAALKANEVVEAMKTKMTKWAQTQENAEGTKLWATSQPAIKKAMDDNLELLQSFVKNYADPKSMGVAHYLQGQHEFITLDDATNAAMGKYGNDMAKMMRMAAMNKTFGGDAAVQFYNTQRLTEHQTTLNKVEDALTSQMIFQPDSKLDNPFIYTFKGSIDAAAQVAPKDPVTREPQAIDTYRKFRDNIQLLTKTESPEIAHNLTDAFFDRHNNGVLDRFKRHDIDAEGRPVDSQASVYAALTSHDVNVAISHLPQVDRDKQRAWAETEGKAIFSSWVRDLSKLRHQPGLSLNYDPKTHEIEVGVDPRMVPHEELGNLYHAKEQADAAASSLNVMLRGLGDIEHLNKGDVNKKLVAMMASMGVDANTLGDIPDSTAHELFHQILTAVKPTADRLRGIGEQMQKPQDYLKPEPSVGETLKKQKEEKGGGNL